MKVALLPGGPEVLVYTGIHGTIGILAPLVSKDDVDFMSLLEQHIRGESDVSLTGRDHLSWRGYYVPVKGVIDGDLCEMFGQLKLARQKSIAAELDQSVGEITRKLESLRVASSGWS
jgi:splicing factor 3B subunit 3